MSDNEKFDGRSREARQMRAADSTQGHAPREGRQASEFGERRRRAGTDALKQRLFVPLDKLDRTKYNYRWITADAARVYQLTEQDDYELVPGTDLGDVKVSHQLKGGDGDGGQLAQILVRKPKVWFDADKRGEQAKIDKQMEDLKRKPAKDDDGALDESVAYVPKVDINFNAPRGEFDR